MTRTPIASSPKRKAPDTLKDRAADLEGIRGKTFTLKKRYSAAARMGAATCFLRESTPGIHTPSASSAIPRPF